MNNFDWSKYLSLAEKLAGSDINLASEEEQRSAISRAYYAAYIKSRNFLRDRENQEIYRQNSHVYVINLFRNSSDSMRQKIGDRLDILRTFRNQADYEDIVTDLPQKMKNSLILARRIISAIERL